MNKKIVVADTSPLIAFGRIDCLSLLSDTLGTMIIPTAVAEECLLELSKPGAIEIQKAINRKIVKIHEGMSEPIHDELFDVLDKGEAAAIALASQLDVGLLIDEKLGRGVAKKLNLKVIGTAGVLLLAKQKKLIDKVSPLMTALKKSGYYLSVELIREVQKRAGENA